jgi:hypothetical protein
MPVYLEISRLHRTVTIVARGEITPDEIRGAAQQLADAHVRPFAKIVEVAGATTEFTPEQIARLAQMLRGAPDEQRGPVAFIVDPVHTAFPQAFVEHTKSEGPITLFKSLREARDWLLRIQHGRAPAETTALPPANETPWSDPNREGVMIRGDKQRGVRIRPSNAA